MQSDNISSVAWTTAQLKVAWLIAIGYSQPMAAKAVGMSLRQVSRWASLPTYQSLVAVYQSEVMDRIEPAVLQNAALALELQRQMFLGEISPDDKRYREAAKLISRLWDKFYTEPTTPGPSPVGNAVQINVNGNGRNGAYPD